MYVINLKYNSKSEFDSDTDITINEAYSQSYKDIPIYTKFILNRRACKSMTDA